MARVTRAHWPGAGTGRRRDALGRGSRYPGECGDCHCPRSGCDDQGQELPRPARLRRADRGAGLVRLLVLPGTGPLDPARGVQEPAQRAGTASRPLVVAAARTRCRRGAGRRRDRAAAWSRRPHPLRGDQGRHRQASRTARHPARRAGHPGPGSRAGTRGPAHRPRRRPGDPGCPAGQERHPRPGQGRPRRERGVRRDRHDLRLAGHRRDHPHRGRRAGRPDAATGAAAGPDVGGDRLGHLHRHGPLDRAQLQRLRAEPLLAARVLHPHRRRVRLGHRARLHRGRGHRRDHRGGTDGRPISSPNGRGCCCRRRPWPLAVWRSRSPRSLTSRRTPCCSPARTPSAP